MKSTINGHLSRFNCFIISTLKHIINHEASFDALLLPYRIHADKIMVSTNLFLFLACLSIAPIHNTYTSITLIGFPVLLLSTWLMLIYPGQLVTRLFISCGFMAYTAVLIHQTNGATEGHFSAFGLIGILLYYRDWRTIFIAIVFIYCHHLVFGYLQTLGTPIYVFPDDHLSLNLITHIIYFLPFIGMMLYLSIWLRQEGYESQHVIALAQRIVQGHLLEDDQDMVDTADYPLISAVRAMKSRLLDLLRIMPVAAVVIRINNSMIVGINAAWIRKIGSAADLNTPIRESLIWTEQTSWDSLMARLQEAPEKLLDKIEVTLRRSDSTPFLAELSLILHENIEPAMAILTIEDITLRRKTEQTMQRLAYRDLLTDLPNRTSLYEQLQVAITTWQECSAPFAVVMIDLDGFKPVNDSYGHDAGDEVLKIIGARLLKINRTNDLVARLGGDEFAIVLYDCVHIESAKSIAQRFIKIISRPIHLNQNGKIVKLGASAGVAHIADSVATTEAILKNADTALYLAKSLGKNQVALHQPTTKPPITGLM